ncbi:MAG: peptide deformylase [Helicobacteraceae bacterium]|nr:peptide deformylase [Candidatus Sulfurimonas ponti]MBL6973340.1 peptide deformylase [Sulfurimonas sp.]
MIKEIVRYPTPPSVEYSTDVRIFTDEISSLIDNLKDTIEANSLDALAAFQIGSMYNVIVIKQEDGSFLELINPRMFNTQGSVTTTEKTAYFPGLSAKITRHEKISVVYEDRELKQHSLKADGALSILLQRKIDYTFGSSFINKLSPEEKKLFETKLEFGSDVAISEVCPTTFKRDYIVKFINLLLAGMFLLFIASFFIEETMTLDTIWQYQLYASFLALGLNIIYFFYAQYEGKLYSGCTSCQIGNIIGTVFISLTKLTLIMVLSYLLIH